VVALHPGEALHEEDAVPCEAVQQGKALCRVDLHVEQQTTNYLN